MAAELHNRTYHHVLLEYTHGGVTYHAVFQFGEAESAANALEATLVLAPGMVAKRRKETQIICVEKIRGS